MRVLHVADVYLPRLGGIELHTSDLVAHQRARGIDAEVATITPAADGAVDPPYVHRLAGGTVPRHLHALPELRDLVANGRYDAVHVHVSVWSPFSTLAGRQVVRSGQPMLATIHSMWTRLGPLPVMARELLRLRGWPMAWSAVSDAAAAPLREMLGPEIPVAVLGNAIDVSAWRQGTPPGGAAGPRRVVSVMRLTRTKRALPLLEMLREVRRELPADVPLEAVVVGDGPLRPTMERFLRRHDMDSWVRLPGTLDRAEIPALLATADLYVAPAELESFGIAALEARAAGLPVVASSIGGVGEFVRPEVEGLLGADDAELVAAMVRLLTDDALRSSIARHNTEVPPVHDWDLACAESLSLYDAAVEAAAARRRAPAWTVALGPTDLR